MILNGNLSQAILMLAVPVMINSFIQSMYNLTDTFWLGRIGTENQSAITLVSPLMLTCCNVTLVPEKMNRQTKWQIISVLRPLASPSSVHYCAG